MFLTSQGVYRLLYNSKKEAAKKFRKWAGNILDDIIFNESTELKKQLEEHKELLEDKEKRYTFYTIIKHMINKQFFYELYFIKIININFTKDYNVNMLLP